MLSPLPDAADRLFRPFNLHRRKAVAVAVSGGGDSLALLLLLKRWREQRGDAPRLVAVTVDHALRPEAAGEARQVAALCHRWNIEHHTLRWTGAKPSTGIADAARLARYRLLAQAAEAAGTDIVLTGHTLEDQAETVAMRLERGAGRGMAGMAGATLHDGRVWVVRPLLAERRAALRALLREAGVEWIEDPSNDNPAAERVRARVRLAAMPGEVEALAKRARAAGLERRALGAEAALVLRQAAMRSPGLAWLPADPGEACVHEAAVYALRILLATFGGAAQLPDAGRTGELLSRLRAGSCSATLSRTRIARRKDGVYLHRETRNMAGRSMVRPGALWDGRFRLRAAAPVTIVPLGADRAKAMPLPADAPRGLAAAALAAEPDRGDAQLERVVSPWALFLPDFDIAAHDAVAQLIGARSAPAGVR